MIYLKNIREKQTVYIPRTEINGKVVAIKSYDEGYADGKEEGKKLQKLKLTNLTVSENGVYKREDGWNEVDIDVKPSLQSKTINITKDVETVMADDAFDGLSRVNVNATQYGKNKRNEGYNQGYLEGEDSGYKFGYTEGKTDGINEQKSKLESITITENGIYTKEDGYNSISVNVEDLNGSYDEGYNAGYDDGLTNAGETAQVLNIIQNGIYTTKYSEPNEANAQVTGYFDDNTPFYGYAHLTNHIIATGITPAKTSRVELWWRPDFYSLGSFQYVFANTSVVLNGIYLKVDGGKFSVKFGNYTKNNLLEVEDKWYHIVVSPDGLVIDGETITTLGTPSMFIAGGGLFINGDGVTSIGNVCANGYFGMVKIDGKTFIPTEDGFIDYTTDTILTAYKEGHYDFEKPTYDGNLIRTIRVSVAGGSDDGYDDGYNAGYFVGQTEGYNAGKTDGIQEGYADGVVEGKELGINEQKSKLESIEITVNGTYTKEDGYDSIVVKVPDVNGSYDEGYEDGKSEGGKIKILDYGLNINYSTFETVPEWMDFEGSTKLTGLFQNCDRLTSVTNINTSSATCMSWMFGYCDKLTSVSLDTSNVTDMQYMFYECRRLTDVNFSDTSNVESMYMMFLGCWSLKTIPPLNTSKVLSFARMFAECTNLTTIPPLDTSRAQSCFCMFEGCNKLTSLPAFTVPNLDYAGADIFAGEYPNLTDFGGLIDLKVKTTTFVNLPNLTYESCINILNGLYDFTGNGKTPSSSPANPEGVIKVHQNFLDKVGDKISIGINKGWTITA